MELTDVGINNPNLEIAVYRVGESPLQPFDLTKVQGNVNKQHNTWTYFDLI